MASRQRLFNPASSIKRVERVERDKSEMRSILVQRPSANSCTHSEHVERAKAGDTIYRWLIPTNFSSLVATAVLAGNIPPPTVEVLIDDQVVESFTIQQGTNTVEWANPVTRGQRLAVRVASGVVVDLWLSVLGVVDNG